MRIEDLLRLCAPEMQPSSTSPLSTHSTSNVSPLSLDNGEQDDGDSGADVKKVILWVGRVCGALRRGSVGRVCDKGMGESVGMGVVGSGESLGVGRGLSMKGDVVGRRETRSGYVGIGGGEGRVVDVEKTRVVSSTTTIFKEVEEGREEGRGSLVGEMMELAKLQEEVERLRGKVREMYEADEVQDRIQEAVNEREKVCVLYY
jgi:hypothetical protein